MSVGLGSTIEEIIKAINSGGSGGGSGGDTTYRGNAITGTSTTPTAFPDTGITNAKAGDWYINTSNGNVYQCTVAGNASTAKWVYKGTQAILAGAQRMGVGIWADDVSDGCGAFLTEGGYLDLINLANYRARINADNVFDNQNYALPNKSGTFALTDDVQANPTTEGTTELTKLQVGDTVYTLPSGGGGGSGSNATVLISVASTNSYIRDTQLSQHNIRVRVISGTLQAGDRLEICRPIAKKSYNLVNGVKKNVRWKQKLKACAYKILTETDIAKIAAGNNILVLTVNHSSDQPNKGFKYTCTRNDATLNVSAPRTIRIVRPTEIGGSTQNIQISNSVYVTRNFGTCVIKGM